MPDPEPIPSNVCPSLSYDDAGVAIEWPSIDGPTRLSVRCRGFGSAAVGGVPWGDADPPDDVVVVERGWDGEGRAPP